MDGLRADALRVADDKFASDARDACVFSSEDEDGAQARKHGPLKSIAQYFCNEEMVPERVMQRVTQR